MKHFQLVTISLIVCCLGSCQSQIPDYVRRRLEKLTLAEFIDEFLRIPQTEVNSNNITGSQGQELSSSGRIPPDTKANLMHNVVQPDGCYPHLVTVPIPRDPDPNVVRFPSCILIERCAGCEGPSDAEYCAVVHRTFEPKRVLVSKYRPGGNSYFMHQTTKLVHIEKHLSCETKCKVTSEDCDNSVHSHHDDQTCQCVCQNKHLESSCVSPKQWDKKICECVCPFVKNCDSRIQAFNTDTCQCERRFLSSASSLGIHSSANDPSGPVDTRGLDNSTVERLRGMIPDNDLPTTTDAETTVLETTTELTTTTEAPTTTPIPVTTTSTPDVPCAHYDQCGDYWVPTLLTNGQCGCAPNFDIFSGGKRKR